MLQKVMTAIIVNSLLGLSTLLFVLGTLQTNQDEVIVAVLDTGIDDTHPLLQEKVVQGYDFVDFDPLSDDAIGHGTHVAGIIASKAPEATILSVRVISDEDRLHNTHLAIMYAIAKGASIINMSYAESYHWLTEMAIRYGKLKGVVFVAASGNRGINDSFYPAKYDGVLSISGINEQSEKLFGNYGTRVSYLAPSVGIRSAGLAGDYAVKSGTSMASAYVSGMLAYLKTFDPSLTEPQLLQYLDESSYFLPYVHEDIQGPLQYKVLNDMQLQTLVSDNKKLAAVQAVNNH